MCVCVCVFLEVSSNGTFVVQVRRVFCFSWMNGEMIIDVFIHYFCGFVN